jgi:hypothetical protein
MATERLSMRQIREILRQKWALRLSHRAVASSLRVGLGTISSIVSRAQAAGLTWGQVQTLADEAAPPRSLEDGQRPPQERVLPAEVGGGRAHGQRPGGGGGATGRPVPGHAAARLIAVIQARRKSFHAVPSACGNR